MYMAQDGERAKMSESEQKLYDEGMRRCGLCSCWDWPVNHHNDCSGCAKAQYGDE